jgi:hypothetical protein
MTKKKTDKRIEETLSFAKRFQRTKLIIALLFGGTLLSLGIDVISEDSTVALKLFKYAAVVAVSYITDKPKKG